MSTGQNKARQEKFNTVLGIAPGDVNVYSCNYDSIDTEQFPDRSTFRNYIDSTFMGYKWQCVEFARRWMYCNYGYVFDDVAMAYHIFELDSVQRVGNGERLPLHSFRNGSRRPPEYGSLLIWNEGGEFETTGHVAVVVEVLPDAVRIVEQNVENTIWPEGQQYSRELPAHTGESGEYWIRCSYRTGSILGWVTQTNDAQYADTRQTLDSQLLNLKKTVQLPSNDQDSTWLNLANPDEAAYQSMMKTGGLCADTQLSDTCFYLSESAKKELKRATNELHALFLHATAYVLKHENLLEKFNIPACLWPKIRQSWENRRNQMITGRFDFSMSANGIKVYEYNADSASCYLEAGKLQGSWAAHRGWSKGQDAGAKLSARLVRAWRHSEVGDDVLHILQDNDPEETYHALYMQEAMEAAGIQSKIITGVHDLHWRDDDIVDGEGVPVKWVWKTWAWETALDQIRTECGNDPALLQNYVPGEKHFAKPRLVDVLLRHNVMVFEPLWTLIPSNKAILAVLWELFPNHPYLLPASFRLTPELRQGGYVSKPIVGRCGDNIRLVDDQQRVLSSTGGQFDDQAELYQALYSLPQLDEYFVQLCTFTTDGSYAGACTRADVNPIIQSKSDVVVLQEIPDDQMLSL